MNKIPHQSKYEVLYGNKIFDLEDSIEIRNKYLLENSFARFSGGVTMDMTVMNFMNQENKNIVSTSEKLKSDKQDMEYFPEAKVSILAGSRGFRIVPISY